MDKFDKTDQAFQRVRQARHLRNLVTRQVRIAANAAHRIVALVDDPISRYEEKHVTLPLRAALADSVDSPSAYLSCSSEELIELLKLRNAEKTDLAVEWVLGNELVRRNG